MKKKHQLTFRAEEKDNNLNTLKELLEIIKMQYGNNPNVNISEILNIPTLYNYVKILFYDDLNIRDFIIKNAEIIGFENNESKIKGLNYGHTVYSEYTKKEVAIAEYFLVAELTGDENTQGCRNDSGEYLDEIYGTNFEYNENSCQTCSYGRIQASNLHINYNDVKKFNIFKFGKHVLLKENLKNKFYAQNFSGVEYRPVNDYKNRNMDFKYYQISIINTLPKMSKYTHILSLDKNQSCRFCNNSTNLLRTNIAYDRTSLCNALDFNNTMEILGHNHENYWIISKKVKDFLDTLDEKADIFCEPIEIIK